jgi:serine-type D-Ala-D-Ala carboxypeptidase/endopeptidase (penicillin-binding protein 4)
VHRDVLIQFGNPNNLRPALIQPDMPARSTHGNHARKRLCGWSLLFLPSLLMFCAFAAEAAVKADPAIEVKARVDRLLASRRIPRYSIGIKVVALTNGKTLYTLNADKPFAPASTMKIVTMAAALERLGPAFRWKTEVWRDGVVEDGVLKGNLIVKGFGNPHFMEEDMEQLARFLTGASIHRITGSLVYDGSFFDSQQLGPAVLPGSQSLFDSRESALAYGFNVFRIIVAPASKPGLPPVVAMDPPSGFFPISNKARTSAKGTQLAVYLAKKPQRVVISGQISTSVGAEERYFKINEPELFFAYGFLDKLKEIGVQCDGPIVPGEVQPGAPGIKLLGTHRSAPLVDLLWMMGKKSNNFVADQLFKTLGAEIYAAPGSFAKGARALSAYLQQIGHNPATYNIVDGSGLSHENRLTPEILMSVLQHVYGSDQLRPPFVDSLAWAGMDGTLGERLVDSETAGRIFAKTGSLSGVSALSGFVAAPRIGDLVFAIMINGGTGRGSAKRLEDAIVRVLAEE